MENNKENYYTEHNQKHSKSYKKNCDNDYVKNKIYNKLSDSLKDKFGEKVLKICVDGHFSCPNRDGKLSKTGCIYCSAKGSGELIGKFKSDMTNDFSKISEQSNNNHNTSNSILYSTNTSLKNITKSKENDNIYNQYGFITEQVKDYLSSYRATRANKFIVYFQNFSNTYDTIDNLKKRYDATLIDDRIVGIDIATIIVGFNSFKNII